MKKTLRGIQLIVAWISFGYLINDAAAAITGQWDFKKGDLSATIGQDMGYLDAETQGATQFGSTTSFGIPNVGGQAIQVLKFPQASTELGGLYAPIGAAANGGGELGQPVHGDHGLVVSHQLLRQGPSALCDRQ